ncbi:CAAD domain-containing protein [Chamaesiphon minutus]|uniref:Cyanobacterial aminoacyl-tRNA synthetase CAAD domain-containing protein n=1 Tax=Chamaesiphon minutus (strain ATCC 27169 / PCC 6605) TaxID=1173020 RepID=K9UJN9_CHAP6|nr:CAAD domain-containing protein [Chamaesiphon minutus]AFY94863.1 hypothetical protein Cha6605_3895 [Chamaesiphon minutus PCC 6605]
MTNDLTISKKNSQQQLDSDLANAHVSPAATSEARLISVNDYLKPDRASTPTEIYPEPATGDSPKELWVDIQTNKPAILLEDTFIAGKRFFKDNQYLLTLIGLSILAVMALKAFFAGLDAIDNIPLVTPILKIVGLIYGARFVWRHLIRKQNRQELFEILNSAKMEVMGR